MNTNKLIAATLLATPLLSLAQPASAASISLTDSWSIGTYSPVSGSGPTFSTAANQGTSNLGNVSPLSDPHTQTLTQNTPTALEILFVAAPNNSGTAAIPVNFTLSDGTGNVSFIDYVNYFADVNTDFDDMAWSTTPPTPGKLTSAPSLVQTLTLSDSQQVQITLPYEMDWNMAQQIQFDYLGGTTGGHQNVPEPGSLALLTASLLGFGAIHRRKRWNRFGGQV